VIEKKIFAPNFENIYSIIVTILTWRLDDLFRSAQMIGRMYISVAGDKRKPLT
jgi:hypothetical protein